MSEDLLYPHMKKIGFTIGKFAPLHKGHQFLIETAIREMDEVYVVVYETDVLNISLEHRADWIKKLYPSVNIILAKNPPHQYGLDESSVKIQNDYLKSVIGDINVTHFYSSEKYGAYVARDFNIINRAVDIERSKIDISATKVRSDIDKYSEYVDKIVFNDVKKFFAIKN